MAQADSAAAREGEVMQRFGRWLEERAPESLAGSRYWLAVAERRAARGLWSASAYLSRAANRLDAAGLAMSLRASERPRAKAPNGASPDEDDYVDDEICAPHLA